METMHYSPSQQLAYLLPTSDQVDTHAMEIGEGELWGVGKSLRKLIKDIFHNPNDPELWYDLGFAFNSKDEQSLTFFYTAYRIAPYHSKYIEALAYKLRNMGDIDAAIKLFDDAIGRLDSGTDECALLQCFKENMVLLHKIGLIKCKLGVEW